MRIWLVALCVSVGVGCAWTPRQRERLARELGRVTAVAVIETVICSRIEKRFEIQGGFFEVPKRGCRRRQLAGGNVEFSFEGSGRFSKGFGFATGEFQQAGAVEYQVRTVGGYIYVVPERVDIERPRLFNLSLVAGAAEALLGSVSSGVSRAINQNLNTPRTIILSMQGRQCVVKGWIAPGAIPIRCGDEQDGFSPVGGSYQPLARAPPGWDREGLDITQALAPEPRHREEEAVAAPVPADAEDGVGEFPAMAVRETKPLHRVPAIPDLSDVPPPMVEAPPSEPPIAVSTATPRPPLVGVPPQQEAAPPAQPVETATPNRTPLVKAAHVEAPDALPTRSETVPEPTPSSLWTRQWDGPTRDFIERNGSGIAEKVQQVTHPTGRSAHLVDFVVRAEGELTAVELAVAWSGRVAGMTYRTTLLWEFSTRQHLRLVLVSDTSGATVPAETLLELDAYFRSVVFPRLPGER